MVHGARRYPVKNMCDSIRTTSSSGGLEMKPVVPYMWPGERARIRAREVDQLDVRRRNRSHRRVVR